MESLKLKVDLIDRTALYFNKHKYRAVIYTPHLFYSYNCKTPDAFRKRIDEICKEYDDNGENWYRWRKPRPDVQLEEYIIISGLICLKQKYKNSDEVTFRRENNTCCVYASDISVLNEIASFHPNATFNQVSLMPAGVKVFKRNPPAKYRAYMSNAKMPVDFKEEMLSYLQRTPDVRPSDSFYTYLNRNVRHNYQSYLWDTYFVDYDDDKNLMMMMLMFPGMVGKTYKLEKKSA